MKRKPGRPREDLTGQKYGSLTAIEFTERRNKWGQLLWKWSCDCGRTTEIPAGSVKYGNTKTCGGPEHRPNRTPREECIYNKWRHHMRNETELTPALYAKMVIRPCAYCGELPNKNECHGVDRIDNNRGYFLDNVQTACWPCNKMKGGMTHEVFAEHIHKMSRNIMREDRLRQERRK